LKFKKICNLIMMILVPACISPIAPANTVETNIVMAASPTSPTATINTPKKIAHPTTTTVKTPVITASATVTYYAYITQVSVTPASSQVLVADHTILDTFDQIPQSAISAAAAKKVLFMHQSTGGYIYDYGLLCLAGLHGDPDNFPQECVTYAQNRANDSWPWYDNSNWSWDAWPTSQADAIAKTDQFVSIVHSQAANYEVIGMKYCYVDGWNQNLNVSEQYYINNMLALESQYPGKTFIWSTSALWGDPGTACENGDTSCQNIASFNQQVRAYAKAHNKPLYDIADIESHDSNGNACTVRGYEGLCSGWYSDSGGHPNKEASIRLAKGFWWLMARLYGWNGSTSSQP
jgi:hypothetical protein